MNYHLADGSPLEITGASYAGRPLSHTVMFASKKVEQLLENLSDVEGCLVFIETDVVIPSSVDQTRNLFVRTDNPQREYTAFVNLIQKERDERDSKRKYTLVAGGYTIGENVSIGEGSVIEPGAFIGHDVVIGRNAKILSGAIIRNALIGDDFLAGENCTIGTFGFNYAKDKHGNNVRIPSLGKVRIGNGVEVFAHSNIAAGMAGDTVICDYAKIDVLVHIGHDVFIGRNAEIPAGVIVGGFARIGDNSFLGVNSSIRNRKDVGNYAFIGMGAAVAQNIPSNALAMGVPAKISGWMCQCGSKLDEHLKCPYCGNSYEVAVDKDGKLRLVMKESG